MNKKHLNNNTSKSTNTTINKTINKMINIVVVVFNTSDYTISFKHRIYGYWRNRYTNDSAPWAYLLGGVEIAHYLVINVLTKGIKFTSRGV